MKQLNLLKSELQILESEYLELINHKLPKHAQDNNWFIKSNYCFQKVILDNIFNSNYEQHFVEGIPAYLQLKEDELKKAISLASRIEEYGLPYLEALNLNSLSWRGQI